MKATKPDWDKPVTPIRAINKIIIGNIWNFLLLINNSKISLIGDNRSMYNSFWKINRYLIFGYLLINLWLKKREKLKKWNLEDF